MNRHHPYGGGGGAMFDGGRRGGPGAPGPDRTHRFSEGRGRGRGRGRGGYNNSNQGGSYGPGPSYDDDHWNDGPPDPYYGQNQDYGDPYGAYESGPPMYNDQSYGSHEDKPFQRGRGRGRGRATFPRTEREEKVQNAIIEERINRERPCRTLFIRNIKYETDSDFMRNKFEDFGEIKTFFDLIANRGMIFVTFYDLRAAERAREHLQGTEISGRPIDVHFSLPRPDELEGKDPRDLNYGTIFATFTNSASGRPIDENELRRVFQHFGEIKVIRPGESYHDQRYVEFFDSRSCIDAYDSLHQQPFQDGFLTLDIVPDIPDVPLPPGAAPRFDDRSSRGGPSDFGDPRGRRVGARGGMRGRGGPPRDDWERRDDYERDFDRPRDDFGGGGRGRGRGRGGRGGFNDRNDNRRNDFGRSLPQNFGPPSPGPAAPPMSFNGPPPPSQEQPADDRLEQARKVQQLLAALKQPAAAAPPPSAPSTMPPALSGFWPPPAPGMPGAPPIPPMYGGGPPPPMSGMPSASPYGMQPPASTPSQAPPPPPLANAGLPPNILAMLQQATQNAPAQPPPNSAPYGMPPPPPGGQGGTSPQDYQALMSYLQNQKH